MMYNITHRIGFIHIPKGAGTSIRSTLLGMFPGSGTWHTDFFNFHMRARRIHRVVLGPDAFASVRWFAVTRHPVHACWADWHWTRHAAKALDRSGLSEGFIRFLDHAKTFTDFESYTRQTLLASRHYLQPGGFWSTFCHDAAGQPLPIRVIRFDSLAEDWQRMLTDWDLQPLPLRRENSSGVPFRRDLVSDQIYGEIMDYCHEDCRLFGYT